MTTRRKLAIGVGAALAVAGGGVAIGATQLSPNEHSKAIVEDAAQQLGVDPERLSDALKQALERHVDESVTDGRLTEEQAERLKERIQSEDYPLFGGPGLGGPGWRGDGHGPGMRGHRRALFFGAALETAADHLGLSEAALRERLREGTSLAAIAKERGKSVDGLVDALVAEKTKRLDSALEDGRLTKEQRDSIVSTLKERVTAIVNGERPARLPGFRRSHESAPGRFGGPGPGWFGPRHGFERRRDGADAGLPLDDVPPPAA